MSNQSTRLLLFAAAGAGIWYFFFRKDGASGAGSGDPTITVSIPGVQGTGTIKLSQACAQARALRDAGNPDWRIWANVCEANGGTV